MLFMKKLDFNQIKNFAINLWNKIKNNRRNYIIFVVCLSLLGLIVVLRFFRGTQRIVYVDNQQLCTELKQKAKENHKHFKFVCKTRKSHFLNPCPVTAAAISLENQFNCEEETESAFLIKKYELNHKYYFPTVESDFTGKTKKIMNTTDPSFTVGFAGDDSIPQNQRAVPVNGIYAGNPEYPLEMKQNLKCTVFIKGYGKRLIKFLDKVYGNQQESDVSFVCSVGDIMVARGVQDVLLKDDKGVEKVFTTTLPVLRNNDLTIGNLEGVVTESTSNAIKTYTFKFKKAVLTPLKDAGFDYFMQTNNHCYDYGEQGFKDTMAALKEYNIPSSGIGANDEEAKQFYHVNLNGQNFAIISCGAYPVEQSGFDGKKTASATKERAGILWQSDEVLELVKKEKDAGNIVIVNVHGGEEYHFVPNNKQRDFYQKLIENGASVVFGSHPHVLQNTEYYKDGLIVYSMGNFVFPGMEGMKGGTDSEIVRLGFVNGKICYVEQYPCKLEGVSVKLK